MSEEIRPLTINDYTLIVFSCVSLFCTSSYTALPHILPHYINKISEYNESNLSNIHKYRFVFSSSLYSLFLYSSLKLEGYRLSQIITYKSILLICFITVILGNLILTFFPYKYYILLGITIFSFGSSACFFPVLNFIWGLYQIEKGLICGAMISISILSQFFFEGFFEIIGANVTAYGIVIIIIHIIMIVIINVIIKGKFTYSNQNDRRLKKAANKNNKDLSISISHIESEGSDMDSEDADSSQLKIKITLIKKKWKKISKQIITKKFSNILLSYILLISSVYIVSISYISFSIVRGNKISFPNLMRGLYLIIASVSSIIWGLLYDLKGLSLRIKYLLLFHLFCVFFSLFAFYISGIVYLIGILNAICFGGVNAMYFPSITREFSMEYVLEIIGIMSIFYGDVQLLIPIILKELCWNCIGFTFLYIVSVGMAIGSYGIVKYLIYPDNRNNKEEEEKKKLEWNDQDKARELRKD